MPTTIKIKDLPLIAKCMPWLASDEEKVLFEKGWRSCKKEVLEILKTTTHTSNGIQIYFGNNHELILKLKESIEKL